MERLGKQNKLGAEVEGEHLQGTKIKMTYLREKTMDKLHVLLLGLEDMKKLQITSNDEEEMFIQELENTLLINKNSMDIETVLKTLQIQIQDQVDTSLQVIYNNKFHEKSKLFKDNVTHWHFDEKTFKLYTLV